MNAAARSGLDRSIEHLGGSTEPPSTDDLSSDPAQQLAVGWYVWLGSPLIDPAARKGGIVVDAQGEDSVVVARDRVRGGSTAARGRQETWFEVWPINDVDMDSAELWPSSKRVTVAKKLLLSIGETLKAGRWTEEDERRMAAAAVLTADVARAWRRP